MTSLPLHFRSLAEIGQMIRSSQKKSVDITRYIINLIGQFDGRFHCYVHLCNERAMAQAQTADAEIADGIYRGPLHGVPIGIKDLCYTKFAPTRAGTLIYDRFVPNYNATVVDLLEAAGAVILGKLSMTEGAYTSYHPSIPAPINPWNARLLGWYIFQWIWCWYFSGLVFCFIGKRHWRLYSLSYGHLWIDRNQAYLW